MRTKLAFLLFTFSLLNLHCSQRRKLEEFVNFQSKTQYAVFFFVTDDCPLCKAYVPLIRNFGDNIPTEWMTISVRMDLQEKEKMEDYGKFGRQICAHSEDIAKILHATVTPEAIIWSVRENRIVYSGAIDNYAYDVGRHRPVATEHYLSDAVKALSAGQIPRIKKTQPIGCFIESQDL